MKKHRITLVGSSCLLLVFTILILDVLAMMAYLSAVNDQRMNRRYADSIAAYTAADAAAVEVYYRFIDETEDFISACTLMQAEGVECQADKENLIYYVSIDDSRLLKAQISMKLTQKQITGWQVVVLDEELSQEYPLWQGENEYGSN